MKIVTIGQPEARKLFARHWFESTGKILDDATAVHLQYAINAVEEALQTSPPVPELSWIDVEKELPKLPEHINYYHVLAVVNGETWTDVVFLKNGNKFISNYDTTFEKALNVTYWMHLPKPPIINTKEGK